MKGNNNIIRQTHNTNVKEATNIIKMSSTITTLDQDTDSIDTIFIMIVQ